MSEVATAQPAEQTKTARKPKGPGLRERIRRRFEDPNPILLKELQSVFRTPLFIRFLYLSTALLALLVVSGGAMAASDSMPPAQVGQTVFQTFFTLALLIVCLFAPAYSATMLTGEREVGTYESLILTGMDPARIVWGKFLAAFSIFAVVIAAFSPVVGISFLFGGISPLYVVFGFVALLIFLAPAVALGISLSAALKSTRISVLLALLISIPSTMMGVGMLTAFGEVARRKWGLSMAGPFFFTEALAERITEWDTVGFAFLLPVYVSGMLVWFFMAGAIASVRTNAEDRSTPFKLWALIAVLGNVVAIFATSASVGPYDMDEVGLALNVMASIGMVIVALVFMNEPALPPRLVPPWPGPLRLFGPGAGGSTRFALLVLLSSALLYAFAPSVARHIWYSHHSHLEADASLAAIGVGNAVVLASTLVFGVLLRLKLGSGAAARGIVLAGLIALTIGPLLAQIILDARAMDRMDDTIPPLLRIAPIAPWLLAFGIEDEGPARRVVEVLVTLVLYGGAGVIFWGLVEAHVRRATKEEAERRDARERRAEEAAQRRISLIPPSARVEDGSVSATEAVAAAEVEAAIEAKTATATESQTDAVPGTETAPESTADDDEEPER